MVTCLSYSDLISSFTLALYIWRFKVSERFGQEIIQDMAEGTQRLLNDSRPLRFTDGETEVQKGAGRALSPSPWSLALSLKRDLRNYQSRSRLSLALQLWEPPACNLPNVTVSWPRW